MIDLHTHSFFSDGELVPSELIRRAEAAGYEAIAITDHADCSNYDFIIPRMLDVCKKTNTKKRILALPGIELTHVSPDDIPALARDCRKIGACIVVVHGETISEPVMAGTNRKALESDIDILAHPGLISAEDVQLAAQKGIFLELTSRKGHSLCNGHVAALSRKYGARLVLNNDAHSPEDLISAEQARKIVEGAGLSNLDFNDLLVNSRLLVERGLKRIAL